MFNAIGRLTNNIRPATVPIRDKECKSIISIEGQILRWKEYLEDILNTSTTNMERGNWQVFQQSNQEALDLLQREKLLMP